MVKATNTGTAQSTVTFTVNTLEDGAEGCEDALGGTTPRTTPRP